jgi:hypothetical protein
MERGAPSVAEAAAILRRSRQGCSHALTKSRSPSASRGGGTGKKKRETPFGMTRAFLVNCAGVPADTKANRRGGYFWDLRNFSTSRAVGMEGWAPLRVTEIAATAEA